MRLKDKVAIVVGAGQSPGEGMGNGRATVMRFVQEGAKVLAVDNRLSSAEETAAIVGQESGRRDACAAFEADVTKERPWRRLLSMHAAAGDGSISSITMWVSA